MARICRNKEAVRDEYLIIRKLQEEIEQKKKEIKICEALIKSSKDAIRNTYKEEEYCRKNYIQWQSYADDWDRRYCKEEYDWEFTEEEVKEYIEENWEHWYNPWGDGRDCTGVWFTSHISVFPIKGMNKTIVYHFQNCDV